MPNYSQRFLRYHRYITNAVEDFLAVSICLPFTMALFYWRSVTFIFLEEDVSRFILNLPLHAFKGIAALTVAPLLASILAIPSAEPPIYKFNLARVFQTLMSKTKIHFFTMIYFSYALAIIFLSLMFFVFSLCLVSALRKFKQPLEEYRQLLTLLAIVVWIVFNIDSALSLIVFTLPYFALSAQLLMMFSIPHLLIIGLAMSLATLEGHLAKISELTASLINSLIGTVQMWLLKINIITFKNKKDVASLDEISDIPHENLFVSNSNYAFDLSMLEGNVGSKGLENYNAPREAGRHPRLEWEDVLQLEQIPELTTRFPKLATFIQDHKNDFKPGFKGKISPQTIEALRKLAKALLVSQSANPIYFAEQIVVEKETFDTYMSSLSTEAKNHLEELNLLGGVDPDYTFKEIFEKVFTPKNQGGMCKKGASRLISETCDYLQNQKEDHTFLPFWQRPNPRFG